MPLNINSEVFITCALTGSGSTQEKVDLFLDHLKKLQMMLFGSKVRCLSSTLSCRDPETGAPSRKLEYYKEVTERIRNSNTDVVLNLLQGWGDMVFGPTSNPLKLVKGTDMISAD